MDNEQKRVDDLISRMDQEFRAGRFANFNVEMLEMDLSKMSSSEIYAVMSYSRHAKDMLPSRPMFLEAATRQLYELIGKERTDRLIKNIL